jgi:hypothetical protein
VISGKDIHNAFCKVEPQESRDWEDLSLRAQRDYDAVATELNKVLHADVVTITAVRCPSCHEMLDVEHCEHHPCFLAEVQR